MSTVAFCVTTAQPSATPYYRAFPSEPITGGSGAFLTVSKVVELGDNRVETLLKAIAANVKKKGTAIVVSHGNDAGLLFVVGGEQNVQLEAPVIQTLRGNLEGRLDNLETAKRLKFGTRGGAPGPDDLARLDALKNAMKSVRDLELSRIDLRACYTGKSPETLRQLQFFFNADLCCAPDSADTFGPVPFADLTSSKADWDKFMKKHSGAIVMDTGKDRFALSYIVIGDQRRVMLDAIATSQSAIDAWVKKFYPPGSKYTGGPLHYHGLTKDLKTIIFSGESAYRDRLVAVTDGRAPFKATVGGSLQRQ